MARKTPRNLDRPRKPAWMTHKLYWHLYRHDPVKLDQLIARYPHPDSSRPAVLVAARQTGEPA